MIPPVPFWWENLNPPMRLVRMTWFPSVSWCEIWKPSICRLQDFLRGTNNTWFFSLSCLSTIILKGSFIRHACNQALKPLHWSSFEETTLQLQMAITWLVAMMSTFNLEPWKKSDWNSLPHLTVFLGLGASVAQEVVAPIFASRLGNRSRNLAPKNGLRIWVSVMTWTYCRYMAQIICVC